MDLRANQIDLNQYLIIYFQQKNLKADARGPVKQHYNLHRPQNDCISLLMYMHHQTSIHYLPF